MMSTMAHKYKPRARGPIHSEKPTTVPDTVHNAVPLSPSLYPSLHELSVESDASDLNATNDESRDPSIETGHNSDSDDGSADEALEVSHLPPPSSPLRHHQTDKKVLENDEPAPTSTWTTFFDIRNCWRLVSLLIVFIAVSVHLYVNNKTVKTTHCTNTNAACVCSFAEISTDYPNQEPLFWRSIETSVQSVARQGSSAPSTILFVATDISQSDDLFRRIIQQTRVCLNSESEEPVILQNDYFRSKEVKHDPGYIIEEQRGPLQKSGIMFVPHLERVPVETVKVFHAICDEYTPLVKRAVIFFTMNIKRATAAAAAAANSTIEAQVEKSLLSHWSALGGNQLAALVARVTEQVLLIKAT